MTSKRNLPGGNWYIVSIVLLIFTFFLIGCSNGNNDSHAQDNQNTKVITDCVGREVQVPLNPQRIACLCPEGGQFLTLYGQGEKIVATTDGMQRDVLLMEMYPHIKGLPIPKKSGVINIEELINTNPDLVFVKKETTSNEAEMEKLQKTGIPVVALEFMTMEEQQFALQMVASILDTEEEHQKYQDFYQQILTTVQERVAQIPDEEKVTIYHAVNEATRTDAAGSMAADWTKAAGVINVSVGEELKFLDGDYYASLEQILLWDPDFIMVNDPNVVGYIMNHEQWRPLQAVKNNQVLPLPNGLSRWGHPSSVETPLVIIWTASTVYPDLFEDIDMTIITRDFYAEFFDWHLNDTDVERILSSKGMRDAKN